MAAVLTAGPGAAASHQTAAVLLGLTGDRPLRVEVITWYVGKGYMTFPKAPVPAGSPR